MKKFKASILSVVAVFSVLLFSSIFVQKASASELTDVDVDEVVKNFDLSKFETQEETFIDENGQEVTIGIEPEIGITPYSTETLPMGKSTWKIYWYTAVVNQFYRIDVNRTSSSTKITNAYDLDVSGIGYSITQTYFGHTSSSAAFEGVAALWTGAFSYNIYLKSSVSGDTLTIKVKA